MRVLCLLSFRRAALPLQQIHFVRQNRLAVPEKRDNDAQSDRSLCRRIRNDEQREDLPRHVTVQPRKRHQVDVHRIQNQLDGHQHDDHIAPRDHPDHAQKEQRHTQKQIMSYRKHSVLYSLFFAMTTAPIIATSNKTEAISNGSRYELNKLLATASAFGGNRFAGAAVKIGSPWPGIFPVVQNITPICALSASVTTSATHFCRANFIWCRATSRLTSMITNIISTRIPPTYRIICTMNKNSARNCRKIPAVARSVAIKKMALCTALRRVTMSAAPATAIPAKK